LLLFLLHLHPQRLKLIAQMLLSFRQHLLFFFFNVMLYTFLELLHDVVIGWIVWGHAFELGNEILHLLVFVASLGNELLTLLSKSGLHGWIKDLFFEPGVHLEFLTHLLHQGFALRLLALCRCIARE